MRKAGENQLLRYESMFLGTVMFAFGLLKFFEPFRTWFHIQIAKSGLPPLSIPVGIAGEMSIGLSFLLASFLGRRIRSLFAPVVFLASAGLMVNMGVAIFVHLQPDVPASVLPLGLKPPLIPLFFMLLAGGNLFQLRRTTGRGVRVLAPRPWPRRGSDEVKRERLRSLTGRACWAAGSFAGRSGAGEPSRPIGGLNP